MSQVTTRSIRHSLAASPRQNEDPVLKSREKDPLTSRSPLKAEWRAAVDSSGNVSGPPARLVPTIVDDQEGYKNVGQARSNSTRAIPVNPRGEASSRYNHRPLRVLNPPSAAAVSRAASSRAASYTPYQRPAAYSRSLLPDSEHEYHMLQRREANRGIRLRKGEYKAGMIIRAPLHEQDSKGGAPRPGGTGSSVATMASEATQAEKYTTESRFGTIFTKYRKMIVVALHQDNYVALPLYTHNGRGLVNKVQPDEFVSVKDHRLKDHHGWKQLSRWEPVVTEYIREGIDLFDPKSTAHLAYPVSRRYALPVVLEGELRSSSFRILKELYGKYANVDPSLSGK
ncbi:MAG: hypothetical protein Q9201_006875 [Fulgogasparrea decipioides]